MVLDDEPAIGRAVQRNLTSEHFEVELAYEVAPVLARLHAGHGDWDVFILDINLRGEMDGIEVLHQLRRHTARTSVVMISGNDSANTAVACLRAGAFDYLTKPIRQPELSEAVSKAAAAAKRATPMNAQLAPEAIEASALIGSSAAISQLRNRIRQVASVSTSIMVQGETGTGKELVARAIHDQSERKHHHFVPLNCAALPEGLIDSELFGHSRGAFTGATADHPGAFVQADRGTLFLDEIGDMALSSQVRLLRAVQEFEVRAVGASSVRRVDVRIISATHVDLEAAVREERFRTDLLYRVDVLRLPVPPLRDRLEDIPELVAHFLRKHGPRRSGRPQPRLPSVDRSTLEVLMSCAWPGNVRQLENAIQTAIALCEGNVIYPSHLPEWVVPRPIFANPGTWRVPSDRSPPQPIRAALAASASRSPRLPRASEATLDPDLLDPSLLEDGGLDDTTEEADPELPDQASAATAPAPDEVMLELDGEELPHIAVAARKVMRAFRRDYLHRLMVMAKGNLTRAARIAGKDRANLRRLLRAHGLNAADYRPKN
jgi:DNA-binding NtrC family response regulator